MDKSVSKALNDLTEWMARLNKSLDGKQLLVGKLDKRVKAFEERFAASRKRGETVKRHILEYIEFVEELDRNVSALAKLQVKEIDALRYELKAWVTKDVIALPEPGSMEDRVYIPVDESGKKVRTVWGVLHKTRYLAVESHLALVHCKKAPADDLIDCLKRHGSSIK